MIDILRNRRSIRKFTAQQIEPEKIDLLKEALLRSPSSRNINPWEFIFVTDKALLAELAAAKQHGSAFLKDAALGIVILGDTSKSDVWVEDCSIASILVQLTAQSLGLGSCWIQIRNRMHDEQKASSVFVQELLIIPSHLEVESIIAIGYPAEEKTGITSEKLDHSKITFNSYSA